MAHIKAQPTCLIIEGNIGAGKSTFLKLLGERLDVQVIYEPDQKWQHVGGDQNLLQMFYQDTKRWAYTFQTYAFISRVVEQESYSRKSAHAVQILERSVYADRYCFAKNCFEMGTMSSLEWQLYKEWFSWLVEQYTVKPTGFIYLRTDPEVCYGRIQKRQRAAESTINFDYIKMLHKKHEDWLIEKKEIASYLLKVPVLVLDCNNEFEQNKREQDNHIDRIVAFFDTISIKNKQPNVMPSLTL